MKGRWGLVTGASDGIGVELCRELAVRGYDLVLVARREERLREVAATIERAHGVATRVIPCDLSRPGATLELHRSTVEQGLGIEFLANNAGLLFNGFFDELPLRGQEDLLAVNVAALTSLSHLFVRDMIARRRGYLLNVASTAAWIGIPRQNVYAASKAYVLSFTLGLADELRARGTGVVATALCPSYTRTKMLDNPAQGAKLAIPDALVLEPARVAHEGVDGCLAGRPMVVPGLSNRVGMAMLQALPRTWVTRAFGALYRRGAS